MGSLSQHLYDVVRIDERIKQGIKSGCIAEVVEKKGFARKKRESDMNSLENGYKGEKKSKLS